MHHQCEQEGVLLTTAFSFLQTHHATLAVPLRSYRQQFRRLKGLLQVSPPQPTALKGSALCYNAATGHLVSYNSRQRLVSVQLRDGTIKSEQTDIQGAATAHKPLLASTGCELVVLAAFDGPLQVSSSYSTSSHAFAYWTLLAVLPAPFLSAPQHNHQAEA